MKWNHILIILTFFASCKHESRKLNLAKDFYSKLQKENIQNLLNIEFGTRGDIEIWTYYLNADYDSTYMWTYNFKIDSFDLIPHPNYLQFKREINDPLVFVKNLENKKNKLGIKAIFNSPWPGHFVKFLFTKSEALIYQPNGFEINSDSKQRWFDELNTGIRINQNWVYLDLYKKK